MQLLVHDKRQNFLIFCMLCDEEDYNFKWLTLALFFFVHLHFIELSQRLTHIVPFAENVLGVDFVIIFISKHMLCKTHEMLLFQWDKRRHTLLSQANCVAVPSHVRNNIQSLSGMWSTLSPAANVSTSSLDRCGQFYLVFLPFTDSFVVVLCHPTIIIAYTTFIPDIYENFCTKFSFAH